MWCDCWSDNISMCYAIICLHTSSNASRRLIRRALPQGGECGCPFCRITRGAKRSDRRSDHAGQQSRRSRCRRFRAGSAMTCKRHGEPARAAVRIHLPIRILPAPKSRCRVWHMGMYVIPSIGSCTAKGVEIASAPAESYAPHRPACGERSWEFCRPGRGLVRCAHGSA